MRLQSSDLSSSEYVGQFAMAAGIGVVRCVPALLIEHPFDCMKTRWQVHPSVPTMRGIFREIYGEKGFKGFYAGGYSRTFEASTKALWRWPLMLALPQFYEKYLPKGLVKEYPTVRKWATAFTLASFESVITTPMERVKVVMMTSEAQQHGIRRFLAQNRYHLVRELTRGLSAVWMRQTISWTTFLVTDDKLKSMVRVTSKGGEFLTFSELMGIGTAVGCINTFATLPFDNAQTQLQKKNPTHVQGVIKTIRSVVLQHGFKGLYRGWKPRVIQYTIHSLFTVTLLEHLERTWRWH